MQSSVSPSNGRGLQTRALEERKEDEEINNRIKLTLELLGYLLISFRSYLSIYYSFCAA